MSEGPGPYELDQSYREPTPLEKNRAVVQWLEYQLRQAKKRVQQLEAEEARERGRREQAHAGLRWKLQPEQSDAPALLHRGDCAAYPGGGGYISRDDALIALEMPEVEPCRVCRPEKGLTQR
ncbi:DUF6233 domain-containing protein [Streptomyces sp. CB02613]|uniref:DUF6233 domain-containing protein n=1 Tax=Streptomyces sp. CB02613 TaxID=2020328 RepID=UPI001F3366D2|nr:DUF6233 domain-containing protein [Streptomyces sp. CB02613]